MTPDGPQSHLNLELEEGTTLGRVIELLGFADQIDNMLVVNGQIADRGDSPKDADIVRTMLAMAGG